jgi:serine protease
MQKSDALLSGDAGHLHVRLIDPVTGQVREVEADAVDGEYSWQIDNLPPGNYQLVAFTDSDNDTNVCDRGEACGAYLTVDEPILIDLQMDMSMLDFQVNYGVVLDLTIPVPK